MVLLGVLPLEADVRTRVRSTVRRGVAKALVARLRGRDQRDQPVMLDRPRGGDDDIVGAVARAMAVVADELERFRSEPATAEELDRSKENVKGRVLLALESTTARMNRLGSSVLGGIPLLSVDEVEARIDAVTIDDLQALAAALLAPERLSAAGIGADESAFRVALEPLSEALAA